MFGYIMVQHFLRDASWELEPNAFAELAQLYSTCDAANCICPQGRTFDNKSEG